jgi:hypothetical protein
LDTHASSVPWFQLGPLIENEHAGSVRTEGGFATEIKRLIYGSKQIEALVEEKSPGKGCMTTSALTTPYHIVVVAKRNQEIVFTHSESAQDCQ